MCAVTFIYIVGNKLHPTHKDYFFKENDPRRAFVQTVVDPRIHFALNCGAKVREDLHTLENR